MSNAEDSDRFPYYELGQGSSNGMSYCIYRRSAGKSVFVFSSDSRREATLFYEELWMRWQKIHGPGAPWSPAEEVPHA